MDNKPQVVVYKTSKTPIYKQGKFWGAIVALGFAVGGVAAIGGGGEEPVQEPQSSAIVSVQEQEVSASQSTELPAQSAPEVDTSVIEPTPEPEPEPAPEPEPEVEAPAVVPVIPVETPVTETPVKDPAPVEDTQATMVIGNKNSKKYHVPSCSSVDDMDESNKVAIESAEAAIAAGYEPCKRCH